MGRPESTASERHAGEHPPGHPDGHQTGHTLLAGTRADNGIGGDAKSLTKHAHEVERGDSNHSNKLLDEVSDLQKSGRLKDVAQKLQTDGAARVMYDEKGEVSHLMFNADSGMKPVDVNVKDKMVNNESRDVAQMSANSRNMDYVGAAITKPASGEAPYSRDVAQKASDMAQALLNNDMNGVSAGYKDIANDPKMQKDVQGALDRAFGKSPITFDPEKGTMQIANQPGQGRAIVFPKDGEPRFADGDGWPTGQSNERPDEKLPPNPDQSIKDGFARASQSSADSLGQKIDDVESLATARGRIDADKPYPSMSKLRDAEVKIYNQDREGFFNDMGGKRGP